MILVACLLGFTVGVGLLLLAYFEHRTQLAKATHDAKVDELAQLVLQSRAEVLAHVAPDDRRRVQLRFSHALRRGGVEAVLDELRVVAVDLWKRGRHVGDVLQVVLQLDFTIARRVAQRHEHERRRDRLRLLVDAGMTHRPRAPGRGVALASAIPVFQSIPRGSPV